MNSFSWIDEYVDGVIELCYSKDAYEICNTLDISIIRINKDDPMIQGSEALYIRNHLNKEVIFIRDDLHPLYEKFILSHELGHALLHIEVARAAYNKKLINKRKLEREANYFALKLLAIDIDKVYCEGLTSEQIASEYCIAEDSLEYISI